MPNDSHARIEVDKVAAEEEVESAASHTCVKLTLCNFRQTKCEKQTQRDSVESCIQTTQKKCAAHENVAQPLHLLSATLHRERRVSCHVFLSSDHENVAAQETYTLIFQVDNVGLLPCSCRS
eukprot:1003205-Pleurochrysis_carterae.AAC.2